MNYETKKGEFSQLIGKKILEFHDYDEIATDDGIYAINLSDDGEGGNDSHAYVDHIDHPVASFGKVITEVYEESDNWGAIITLKFENSPAMQIVIAHDHNGYYGFSYSLEKQS